MILKEHVFGASCIRFLWHHIASEMDSQPVFSLQNHGYLAHAATIIMSRKNKEFIEYIRITWPFFLCFSHSSQWGSFSMGGFWFPWRRWVSATPMLFVPWRRITDVFSPPCRRAVGWKAPPQQQQQRILFQGGAEMTCWSEFSFEGPKKHGEGLVKYLIGVVVPYGSFEETGWLSVMWLLGGMSSQRVLPI